MATADDAAAAARARDQIEEQARLVYAAALAYVALHDGEEEPGEDSAVARGSKTLALLLLRARRHLAPAAAPALTGDDRQEWIRETAREVTARAVDDARAHWSTVFKRARAADPDVSTRAVKTAFADEGHWAEAAARTRATRLAAETAMSMHSDIEAATGEKHSKLWISRGDPKVRKSHRLLHGQTQPIGKAFKEDLHYPGDPKAPLDETINCRCVLFLVPTKDAPLAEDVFHVDDEDFDVPVAASALARAWDREQARRDWMYELGIHH